MPTARTTLIRTLANWLAWLVAGVVVAGGATAATTYVAAVAARRLIRHGEPLHLFLVGDSLVWKSTPELAAELQPSYRLTIDGRPGMRCDQMVSVCERQMANDPADIVIVNLGTNDALQQWPIEQTEKALEDLAASFGSARVMAITLSEHMEIEGTRVWDECRAFNELLRVWAARHGYRIIEWPPLVMAGDTMPDPYGPVLYDTVHPSAYGSAVMARAYARELSTLR